MRLCGSCSHAGKQLPMPSFSISIRTVHEDKRNSVLRTRSNDESPLTKSVKCMRSSRRPIVLTLSAIKSVKCMRSSRRAIVLTLSAIKSVKCMRISRKAIVLTLSAIKRIIMGLLETYHYYTVEIADKRTNDWFLVGSPVAIILISLGYLYFVQRCGPRYMKDKPPYSFKMFIRFYDICQIVANALLVYHILDAGWYEDYFFYCVPPDYSTNPKPYKIATIMWYVMLLKLIDLSETFMFVLRKKYRQITFLHLYHHVMTFVIAWLNTKYWSNGPSLTVVIVNCSIHVIMYTYYLLASFGPQIQPYLQPLKPIITFAQMVQFVVLTLYSLQSVLPYCFNYEIQGSVIAAHLSINFVLFYNFYRKSYTSNKNKNK
ncbi:very long chain fatty acid elongase 1-like [Calliopsis andreniformis]|uniref:very long chain fatty acid elongase 1-like n=1 Tax=Calliopsis andreniformis TaxID=337506 RepID=UPI003FCD6B16